MTTEPTAGTRVRDTTPGPTPIRTGTVTAYARPGSVTWPAGAVDVAWDDGTRLCHPLDEVKPL